MPQEPGSAPGQSIGNPGMVVLSWASGAGTSQSVSFDPTYMRITQLEFAPTQRLNIAVSGKLHVFELSTNEGLVLPSIIQDMPYFDALTDPRENHTQGLQSLLSFIRYTLSYYANSCTITTADGMIEHVQYYGGAETFREAGDGTNRSPRAQRWSGEISWLRCQQ